jgi:hypothetical protein
MVLTISGTPFVRQDFLKVHREHLFPGVCQCCFHKSWFVASCARDLVGLILSDHFNKSQKSRLGIPCPKINISDVLLAPHCSSKEAGAQVSAIR